MACLNVAVQVIWFWCVEYWICECGCVLYDSGYASVVIWVVGSLMYGYTCVFICYILLRILTNKMMYKRMSDNIFKCFGSLVSVEQSVKIRIDYQFISKYLTSVCQSLTWFLLPLAGKNIIKPVGVIDFSLQLCLKFATCMCVIKYQFVIYFIKNWRKSLCWPLLSCWKNVVS
jgi:hypothetical protein